MRAIVIAATGVALVLALHAQQPPRPEPSFRSASSELVVLPVTVTDKRGGFVSDLPADRFHVFDNGRRQPIKLFTNEDTPVTVGLVIDNSASMRPKLGEVIAATLAFARSSNPHDELFMIEFNERVRDTLPDHHFLMASDVAALEAELRAQVPRGRTAMYDALLAALDRAGQGTRPRKVLILISDGGDNTSRAKLDAVLTRARESSTSVYTIGLFDPNDPDINPGVLKNLARTTGGERFLPTSPGVLLQACERIAREIRSGYTIGYEPPDRDGAYHRVHVTIESPSGRRLNVRTRPGYVAAGRTGVTR